MKKESCIYNTSTTVSKKHYVACNIFILYFIFVFAESRCNHEIYATTLIYMPRAISNCFFADNTMI